MSEASFTKLMSSLLYSSVWQQPDPVRIVWITMLAMADRNGFIGASVSGIAHMARVSLKDCTRAIETFKAPDPDSRNKAHQGRRVAEAERGYQLLNYLTFRALRDAEARREQDRNRKRQKRGAE